MKNVFKGTFAILGMISLSSCATMISGTTQDVSIASFPQGAALYVNGEYAGETPLSVAMNRDSHPLIVLKKDGYADTRVQIKQEWNEATMLNLFFPLVPWSFPIAGWIIDFRSGATSEYAEDDIVVPVLTKDLFQNVYYKGNVRLTNLDSMKEISSFNAGEMPLTK